MNQDPNDSSLDDLDIDIVEGPAREAAADDDVAALPRILRYAILASRGDSSVYQRLLAEIHEVCPGLPLAQAWFATPNAETGGQLAAELDRRGVVEDRSELRSLADCVRLLSLDLPHDRHQADDHRCAARALLAALRRLRKNIPLRLAAEVEAVTYGWAALPVCSDNVSTTFQSDAVRSAAILGARMAKYRIADAGAKAAMARDNRRHQPETNLLRAPPTDNLPVPEGHVVVARIAPSEAKSGKLKDIITPLTALINAALPLVKTPILSEVRRHLLIEFPHAVAAIDFALADLVGRPTVTLRPLLLVGPPGAGKSRFVQRLCDHLGIFLWRTDATGPDGGAFAGTDRRWSTAQICRPGLAINRARHANPAILLDEIEKASTGREHSRLFDCLLAFLEPQTAGQYPDPALQVPLDLRHVSYIATANATDALPTPLRDRFREVTFPEPKADDLTALLPAVIADILRDRGLDPRWMAPIAIGEKEAIERYWKGGSVRRLRRIVEVILRERDGQMSCN